MWKTVWLVFFGLSVSECPRMLAEKTAVAIPMEIATQEALGRTQGFAFLRIFPQVIL